MCMCMCVCVCMHVYRGCCDTAITSTLQHRLVLSVPTLQQYFIVRFECMCVCVCVFGEN